MVRRIWLDPQHSAHEDCAPTEDERVARGTVDLHRALTASSLKGEWVASCDLCRAYSSPQIALQRSLA